MDQEKPAPVAYLGEIESSRRLAEQLREAERDFAFIMQPRGEEAFFSIHQLGEIYAYPLRNALHEAIRNRIRMLQKVLHDRGYRRFEFEDPTKAKASAQTDASSSAPAPCQRDSNGAPTVEITKKGEAALERLSQRGAKARSEAARHAARARWDAVKKSARKPKAKAKAAKRSGGRR